MGKINASGILIWVSLAKELLEDLIWFLPVCDLLPIFPMPVDCFLSVANFVAQLLKIKLKCPIEMKQKFKKKVFLSNLKNGIHALRSSLGEARVDYLKTFFSHFVLDVFMLSRFVLHKDNKS